MSELTKILHAAARGDSSAACKLLPLVYDELRKLAARIQRRNQVLRWLRISPFPNRPL